MNEETGKQGVINKLNAIIELSQMATSIVASEASWETKYEIIFNDISNAVEEADSRIEYYDPDSSYEDDVRAFVSALSDRANEYRELLKCL